MRAEILFVKVCQRRAKEFKIIDQIEIPLKKFQYFCFVTLLAVSLMLCRKKICSLKRMV